MIIPVILCGGSGSRLWPFSRKAYPKQLLSLSSDYSLLQETMMRLKDISDLSSPIVICNEAHRFIVAEQLLEVDVQQSKIILEPCARNTAPAVALAALEVAQDAVLLVLPADHSISNSEEFCTAVKQAFTVADKGSLVTFGIQPERPETGYGYIKKANLIDNTSCFNVEKFVEKPQKEQAVQYMQSRAYLWNSGIFMFKANVYLRELERYSPGISEICQRALIRSTRDADFIRLDESIFSQCENESIDYAVMEKSKSVAVMPLVNSGWSDLGSWDTVYDARVKDQNLNVIRGDVYIENVKNCYLHAEDRLLAVVGVEDHIVVETADAVLVAHKSASQDVKKIVTHLQEKNRSEIEFHRCVRRPWGSYEVLDLAKYSQVKRITVKPGASLSLQMHYHRSEHWVVISGQAEVTRGEEVFMLKTNESTYIPAQYKHRLTNPGVEDLVIIEVQTGSYLGEDDIVRFEDNYGRLSAAVSA